MMEVVVTTEAIGHTKLQSNHHQQGTNSQFLQAGCPSCRPTNSVKALKSIFVQYLGNLKHFNTKMTLTEMYCMVLVLKFSFEVLIYSYLNFRCKYLYLNIQYLPLSRHFCKFVKAKTEQVHLFHWVIYASSTAIFRCALCLIERQACLQLANYQLSTLSVTELIDGSQTEKSSLSVCVFRLSTTTSKQELVILYFSDCCVILHILRDFGVCDICVLSLKC